MISAAACRSAEASGRTPTVSVTWEWACRCNAAGRTWAAWQYLAGHQHVTACAKTRSGGLSQLDPVALGIGDPAEPADTFHVLRVPGHVSAGIAQAEEKSIMRCWPSQQ